MNETAAIVKPSAGRRERGGAGDDSRVTIKALDTRRRLGDLFAFKNGRAFKKEEWCSEGLPIIRIQNLNNESGSFNYYAGAYSDDILVQDGDLLFSWSGTVGSSFGPHVWQRGKGLLNQHIFAVSFKTEMDKRYAYYALEEITEEIEQQVSGAVGLVHITKEKLNDFTIPAPPLPEQQRIVGILDEAFEGIATAKANTEKNLQNARALFEGYLQIVLTQRGEGWVDRTLDQVCIVERGSSPRPIKEYFTTEPDGVNWIKIGDTEEGGKYVYSTGQKITPEGAKRSRFVKEGDFILTNSMSYGRPYIMKTSGYIHDGWFVLRLNMAINTDYFYYLLSSPVIQLQFASLASGSVVKNISGDLVKKAVLPIPPLEHQHVIVEKLLEMSEETQRLASLYERKLAALDALKKSLLHQAFTGQLGAHAA